MTTICEIEVVCAVCGTSSSFSALMSTTNFGCNDLDGRPPEMERDTMHLWLQYCEHCGYINNDIGELHPNAQEIINSQEYKSILTNKKYPPLSQLFLCDALFYPDDHVQAGNQVLCAAWVCDDGQNQELAREFRNWAANRLLTLQPFTGGQGGDINTGMQLVDILRRAERGAEAMDLARCLLADPQVQAEKKMVKILEFQLVGLYKF
ncbi:hypothetical protein GlitD10_0953 [Gloeomargarita lithophora Alchichica-D10]|uniref:Uncharacterized protein n=1 Tax=Gloeomargarita lithophora Alchichica-D10 TaxID=1188229 RepID=A0A1J0ABG7_9CYAN|nr:hypothetical protein [Gloeomargarita lithophora]APB33271.1 hypothetical protein GlitD10_0953 [Gloeomargarita lithophora Alchichica-D10]